MASGDSGNGRGCAGVTKSSSKVSIICLVPVCPWCCCWSPWAPRRCPPPVRGPFFYVRACLQCFLLPPLLTPDPTALCLPFVVSLSNHERRLHRCSSFDGPVLSLSKGSGRTDQTPSDASGRNASLSILGEGPTVKSLALM